MKKFLAAASILLLGTAHSSAWVHGVASGASNVPVLQAVSVPFGVKTPTGRGGVRLSSLDVTTTSVAPQTFSGLDIMSPTAPACDAWTITFVSNSSSRPSTDFTLIAAGTPEGASAITPVPSSTGNGNLAGTYVWNVSCTRSGQGSNTVTLTYTPDANTATVGTSDSLSSGFTPGTWGNIAGQRITAAVGMVKSSFNPAVPNYANQVTITPADTSRRPYVTQLGVTGANPGNVFVTDWVLSGAISGSPTNLIAGATVTAANAINNVIFDKVKYYGSEAMNGTGGNGSYGAAGWVFNNGSSCGSNCIFQNSEFNYVESGFNPKTNTSLSNVVFRYVYNNCLFWQNVTNVSLTDVSCMAPMQRFEGPHPDNMQISDGATPGPNITIQRFLAAQADGDYFAQGPYFGGSIMNVQGYVSAGTGNTNPGNIFTKTSGNFGTTSSGNLIVIPGSINQAAGITMTCTGSCSTATAATLNGLAATNIGSSGSPVTMYGVGTRNFQMSGIMSSQAGPYGTSTGGNSGNSYIYDYDYVSMNTQNPAIGTFTGSITSGVLTATTAAVSNIPGQTAWIAGSSGAMGRLNYSGCAYASNCTVTGKLTGSDTGPGTFSTGGPNVASGSIQISGAYPGQAVPAFEQSNCGLPDVQGGTYNVDRGTYDAGMFPVNGSCVVGTNFPAANTTIGSHAFGPTKNGYTTPGGAVTGADYASGVLPSVYLAAHSFTSSDTPADILRINCLANKPSLGGKRDAGGGLGYGAITPATAANGSGGGNWMIFNGTSHVASTHITGCEAIP